MFVQISPSDNDVSETLSSLNFASRVRRIELGPAKKQVDTVELQKTKQMVSCIVAEHFPLLTLMMNLHTVLATCLKLALMMNNLHFFCSMNVSLRELSKKSDLRMIL